MATLPKLNWTTVNVDTMPQVLKKEYDNYRKLLGAAEAARKEMEAKISAHLTKSKKVPEGLSPRFTYRWGKMAIAFAEPSAAQGKGGDTFTF